MTNVHPRSQTKITAQSFAMILFEFIFQAFTIVKKHKHVRKFKPNCLQTDCFCIIIFFPELKCMARFAPLLLRREKNESTLFNKLLTSSVTLGSECRFEYKMWFGRFMLLILFVFSCLLSFKSRPQYYSAVCVVFLCLFGALVLLMSCHLCVKRTDGSLWRTNWNFTGAVPTINIWFHFYVFCRWFLWTQFYFLFLYQNSHCCCCGVVPCGTILRKIKVVRVGWFIFISSALLLRMFVTDWRLTHSSDSSVLKLTFFWISLTVFTDFRFFDPAAMGIRLRFVYTIWLFGLTSR